MRLFDLGTVAQPVTTELRRSTIPNESTLESLLHANPGVLLSEPVFIFGRQSAVETGILDLLALDQYGNLVIFELKVGDSGSGSASEETILSQPQNYAQSLATYDYEALNKLYQEYRKDVEGDRWEVSEAAIPASDLDDAFEHVFGQPLKPSEFNAEQRMVIVAETITCQTEQNARYLLQEGLNIQCIEIQQFKHRDDERPVLATSVPIDYDESRIRPERHENPAYPDLVRGIAQEAFPMIQDAIHADRIEEVMTGQDGRNPTLRSNAPDHPDVVVYSIRVKPDFGQARVVLSLDRADKEVLNMIRAHKETFEDAGFEVSHSRDEQRVVVGEWEINRAEQIDEADIARQFARLVELGHAILDQSGSEQL